jgi:hypothetical protein
MTQSSNTEPMNFPKPFALFIEPEAGSATPQSHLDFKKAMFDDYVLRRPGLRDILCMADTFVNAQTIKTSTKETTAKDGNQTIKTSDEHQTGTDTQKEQVD